MKIPLIRIGNSKGIRLTKDILKRYGIKDQVELIFEENYIILKPIAGPRSTWSESFRQMRDSGDDQLLMDDVFEHENIDAWR